MKRGQYPYAVYDVSDDGQIVYGNIFRDGIRGNTELFLTGLAIKPDSSASCNLDGAAYSSQHGVIELKTTKTAFNCEKMGDFKGSVNIDIQTSEGAVSPILLPSQRAVDLKFGESESLISAL